VNSGPSVNPAAADCLLSWLREDDPDRLARLWERADEVRREEVGDAVHLRGLIEFSNHCIRQCAYCGLRAGNRSLVIRYRMEQEEIVAVVRKAADYAYGTVVLQAGEDPLITADWMAALVRRIKRETPLAVTLSLGERSIQDFAAWRQARADRYLLRFETSDRVLYRTVHPNLGGRRSNRIADLRKLRRLGYEIGSGIMVGLPGQTYRSVAQDILLFRQLDLDMIGIGPFIPHPDTPLGSAPPGLPTGEQVPNTEEMVYKVIALARLACPEANIPSTTALATINISSGRERGLQCGANVVMPNLTPMPYRRFYEIYPGKACLQETGEACNGCLRARLAAIGRYPGLGQGGRQRLRAPAGAARCVQEELVTLAQRGGQCE